jgi:hypothetical protein
MDGIIWLGVLITFVAWIWIIVLAFKKSIGWGFACMFIPLAPLVYVIMYRRFLPLAVLVVGILMYFTGLITAIRLAS